MTDAAEINNLCLFGQVSCVFGASAHDPGDGGLAGTAAPAGSLGESDSRTGEPRSPGSAVRRVTCCLHSLKRCRIFNTVSEHMDARSSTEIMTQDVK